MVMFAFLFRKRNAEKLAVIFDIGSGSVGGALVGLSKNELPKIFYTTRHNISVSKERTPEIILSSMSLALRKVAHDIEREGFPHVRFTFFSTLKPSLVFVTLTSPWHISQVRTIRKKESNSFRVDRDIIRDLILKELNAFRNIHATHFRGSEQKYEIIEGDVLDIRLNKYPVVSPVGKIADELELTLFASSALKSTIDIIETVAREVFQEVEIQFSSFTLAFFNTVRDIWHQKREYL
ncbi:MAG: hypothetical protein HYT27_03080, partial [Parcubacteria group bacterium]|nr:hypothetical protein [Parcubacteria group bacterium]